MIKIQYYQLNIPLPLYFKVNAPLYYKPSNFIEKQSSIKYDCLKTIKVSSFLIIIIIIIQFLGHSQARHQIGVWDSFVCGTRDPPPCRDLTAKFTKAYILYPLCFWTCDLLGGNTWKHILLTIRPTQAVLYCTSEVLYNICF